MPVIATVTSPTSSRILLPLLTLWSPSPLQNSCSMLTMCWVPFLVELSINPDKNTRGEGIEGYIVTRIKTVLQTEQWTSWLSESWILALPNYLKITLGNLTHSEPQSPHLWNGNNSACPMGSVLRILNEIVMRKPSEQRMDAPACYLMWSVLGHRVLCDIIKQKQLFQKSGIKEAWL